jgi:hypothetical protein
MKIEIVNSLPEEICLIAEEKRVFAEDIFLENRE